MLEKNIFERLQNGETIAADDAQAYKMREASFANEQRDRTGRD